MSDSGMLPISDSFCCISKIVGTLIRYEYITSHRSVVLAGVCPFCASNSSPWSAQLDTRSPILDRAHTHMCNAKIQGRLKTRESTPKSAQRSSGCAAAQHNAELAVPFECLGNIAEEGLKINSQDMTSDHARDFSSNTRNSRKVTRNAEIEGIPASVGSIYSVRSSSAVIGEKTDEKYKKVCKY